MIGGDIFNGTASQLRSFKTQTGATYPLLLTAGSPTGGSWSVLYGPWDNYVIVDRDGIVRYHAAQKWPHGNRYHLTEIRSVVDSILAVSAAPGDPPVIPALTLTAGPNPFRSSIAITLTSSLDESAPARVLVIDLSGRIVATLMNGAASPGTTRLTWNGFRDQGGRAASGRYLIRAELQGSRLVRPILLLR